MTTYAQDRLDRIRTYTFCFALFLSMLGASFLVPLFWLQASCEDNPGCEVYFPGIKKLNLPLITAGYAVAFVGLFAGITYGIAKQAEHDDLPASGHVHQD